MTGTVRMMLVLAAAGAALLAAGCDKQEEKPAPRPGAGKLFGPSAQELVDLAFDLNDADHRREGIDLLSRKRWGRDEKYLRAYALALRQDKDSSVRAMAARALGRAGNEQYLGDVVAALSDESPMVRLEAAMVLDKMPCEPAARPLTERAVLDDSVDVRLWCAKALHHYRQGQVLATLVRCLDDPSFSVAYHARRSLVALTGRDMGNDPVAWAPLLAAGLPPEQPARPWWDWFGTTARKPATQPAGASPPASQPQAGGR